MSKPQDEITARQCYEKAARHLDLSERVSGTHDQQVCRVAAEGWEAEGDRRAGVTR